MSLTVYSDSRRSVEGATNLNLQVTGRGRFRKFRNAAAVFGRSIGLSDIREPEKTPLL